MNPRGFRYPGYCDSSAGEIRSTIFYLLKCRIARRAGWKYPNDYSVTRDPEWLVDMAINRRAGWPDDPSTVRGSAASVVRWHPGIMVVPIFQYPKSADGDRCWRGLVQFASRVNSRSLIWAREAGWLPRRVRERLAHRFTDDSERF